MFSQKIDETQKWDANFASFSPIFSPLNFWAEKFSKFKDASWPELDDYQAILSALPEPLLTQSGKALKIVQQDGKPGGQDHRRKH